MKILSGCTKTHTNGFGHYGCATELFIVLSCFFKFGIVEKVLFGWATFFSDYWANAFIRPCRWGLAMKPSDWIRKAMHGVEVEERNQRCEDVIAKGLAQGLGTQEIGAQA